MQDTINNFDEFVKRVKEDVAKLLPENIDPIRLETRPFRKLGNSYLGLHLERLENEECIVVNLNDCYERYRNGANLEILVQEITKLVQQETDYRVEINIKSYEEVKKYLYIRVCNVLEEADILKTVPHMIFGDMAITYHVKVGNIEAGGIMSWMITNDILESYHILPSTLHTDAVMNSQRLFPMKMISMSSQFIDELRQTFPNDPVYQDISSQRCFATNSRELYGAAVMFYPKAMEEIANKFQSDFYILPTCVHLLIIEKAGENCPSYEDLLSSLIEMNQIYNEDGETLSNQVYYYLRNEKRIIKLSEHTIFSENHKVLFN